MFSRLMPSPTQQIEAGERRGAGAGAHELHLVQVLADDAQPVQDRGADDDRGAVLVVVKHRDLHPLAAFLLDVEALGRLDVLEIDAAERGLERDDHVDQLVRVELVDLDVEAVEPREFLEQHRLAFHDGLRGERSDRAQAEHRGAVGHDGDQIAARGQRRGLVRIADDFVARRGNARRVGERQVALVGELLGRQQRDLARRKLPVIFEGSLADVFVGHGGGLLGWFEPGPTIIIQPFAAHLRTAEVCARSKSPEWAGRYTLGTISPWRAGFRAPIANPPGMALSPLFWSIAFALVAGTLAILVLPLLRRSARGRSAGGSVGGHGGLPRSQAADRGRFRGGRDHHRGARHRARRAHRALRRTSSRRTRRRRGPAATARVWIAALVLVACVPVVAGVLYFALGNPAAMTAPRRRRRTRDHRSADRRDGRRTREAAAGQSGRWRGLGAARPLVSRARALRRRGARVCRSREAAARRARRSTPIGRRPWRRRRDAASRDSRPS